MEIVGGQLGEGRGGLNRERRKKKGEEVVEGR